MSSLSKTLRCLNPLTGKRDGNYCTWEGQDKCLLCMAADEIDELEAQLADKCETIEHLRKVHYAHINGRLKAEAQLDAVRQISADEIAGRIVSSVAVERIQATLNGEDTD